MEIMWLIFYVIELLESGSILNYQIQQANNSPGLEAGIFSKVSAISGYGIKRSPDLVGRSFITQGTPRKFYADLEDNEITVVCDSLIHSRMRTTSNSFVLIPNEPGDFEIKVSVICEEYTQPEELIIPIVIKEN